MAHPAYDGHDSAGTSPKPAATNKELEDLRRQIVGVVDHGAIANKLSDSNDANELRSSPYAVHVLVEGAKPGAAATQFLWPRGSWQPEGGLNVSAVLGIVAASTAITALAGGAVSPAVAFGTFLVLLGGLALAMASVRATTTT